MSLFLSNCKVACDIIGSAERIPGALCRLLVSNTVQHPLGARWWLCLWAVFVFLGLFSKSCIDHYF